MNITFLIGNGFDRGCGLKSSFSDTYAEYCAEKSSSPEIEEFKHTINSNITRWSDFEMSLAEYAHNVKNEMELLNCIRDYSHFLNGYLKKEEQSYIKRYENFNKEMKNAICERMIDSILRFYKGTTKNEEYLIEGMKSRANCTVYSYISFNYTSIFEFLLERMRIDKANNNVYIPRFESGIHVHGALDADIVLGIDNEEQLEKLHYSLSSLGKMALIKPYFNQMHDNKRVTDAQKLIDASDIICIFGMSLGDSDMTWRDKLSKWLLADEDHHLYYYYHDAMQQNGMLYFDRIDYSIQRKRKIMKMLNLEEDDQLQNRIHVPVGVMLFNPSNVVITETKGATIEYILK